MARELVELGKARHCAPGKIWRKGYTAHRKGKSIYVPGGCVIDQGAPGKTPASKRVLPRPKPGGLRNWEHTESASKRHSILRELVAHKPCVVVVRDLNLLANFTKKTSPATHAKARADMKWLEKQSVCHLKTKK